MLEGMVEEEEVQQELEKKELAAKEALNADRARRVEERSAKKSYSVKESRKGKGKAKAKTKKVII